MRLKYQQFITWMGIRLRKCVEGWKGKWDVFPLVRQKDQMDCGPACLRMLIKYYRLPDPDWNEIRSQCSSSRDGVSLAHLIQASNHFGFRTEAVRTQISELVQLKNPCVLLWNRDHYVVHYAFEEGVHWLADPAVGILKFRTEELQDLWYSQHQSQGVLIMFTPPTESEIVRENKKTSSLWNSFRTYVPQFRYALFWLFGCFLLSGFFAMLLPMMFQVIVDVAVVQKNWNVLMVFVVAQFCLYVGQLSSEIVRTWIVLGMGTFINLDKVSLFFRQLVRLKWPFFANRMLGDIMLRIDDHKRIERFMLGPAMELVMSIIQLFFLTLVLLRYSPMVFLFVFCAALGYYLWYRRFMRQRAYLDYELFRREATHRSLLVEIIDGMQEIKISGSADIRIQKWEKLREDYFYSQVKSLRIEEKQNAGIVLMGAIRDVVITAWTAHLAIEGTISIGMLFSIQFVVGQMGEPIRQWIETSRMNQDAQLSSQRIQDVYDEPIEVEGPASGLAFYDCSTPIHIDFHFVSFSYPGLNVLPVLRNLQFNIGPGFYAIVGESGCGKTSLLKLLLGFYQPQSGRISINGADLENIDMQEWRRQCGVVLQDGYVFSDTILSNVAPADVLPDKQRVFQALETCCLWDWVRTLPKEMLTIVGKEGVGLSQGQRQRLLLARALYKNPKVLLLDEATNALDVQTESRLWNNLQQAFMQRTTLVVAHRLSTVVNAKEILVMHKGSVVERGTHEQLLKQKSYYYELIKHQMYV